MKPRSSRWIVPALAAAAAGALAYGVTRRAACRDAEPGLDHLRDVSFLRTELKLTDAQAAAIEALHTTLAARLGDCCSRHCGARVHLAQAVADETNSAARADAVLDEMCRAYAESERATLDHIRGVRGVLDAKQRAQFDRMLTECLCRECTSCAASRQSAEPGGHRP